MDLTLEIRLQTTRSGGKGGQNVNKVETAVLAYFDVAASQLLTEDQKTRIREKLSNRINAEGELWVRRKPTAHNWPISRKLWRKSTNW